MLLVRPAQLTFGTATWPHIDRVAIDRTAKAVREWTDDGPHPVFVDCPEQLTRIRIVQTLDHTTLATPIPGDMAELRIDLAPTDARRRRVRCTAVVESVTHDLAPSRATRTITLTAVSTDGDTDPLTITDTE
jgi:hypothetical protein